MPVILFAVAAALGTMRIAGFGTSTSFGDQCFKDAAHLYVAGLFGYWLGSRYKVALCLAIALTVLETACFLLMRSH